jgi:hypothetical protein
MLSRREIARTEQRIAEVDNLQQTIEQLQADLKGYRDALLQQLTALRQEAGGLAGIQAEGEVLESALENDPFFRDLDQAAGSGAAAAGSPFETEEEAGQEEQRTGGKPVSVLISDGSISEEPLSGWVIDRPAGGLKILVDDEIKIGTVIGVRPNREHPHAQWINVSVKGIRPERQSFVITCQFVERPPWNALALLNG